MIFPLRRVGHRFYFYSYDCSEPRHTHADRENCSAKSWLDPDTRPSQITIIARENCAASSACLGTWSVTWYRADGTMSTERGVRTIPKRF
ncbi:MAG TPA: DUF4160 domain-containing protein [Blastocatellia bacterium]|nr:DUF4160 domain-containing protein [Blastocatellia bacterium]